MLNLNKPILSICLSCRYNLEDAKQIRAGKQFSENVLDQIKINRITSLNVRGVNCMSQCKRSCIISLTAKNSFTYITISRTVISLDYIRPISVKMRKIN